MHLAARAAGVSIGVAIGAASGLPCRGSIEINGLAARGEGLTTKWREVRDLLYPALAHSESITWCGFFRSRERVFFFRKRGALNGAVRR